MTNSEWVEEVARQNYDKVLKAAYRCAREHHIPNSDSWARDMTQTVFLNLNAQLKEKDLRNHENILAWLLSTLYHVIGNDWQKRSNREIPIDRIESLRQAPVCRLVIDDPFPAGLPEADRDLLYRCHCLQIPRREIADSLGITLGACQMRLERAEEKCRALYAAAARPDGVPAADIPAFRENGADHI